MLPLNILLSFKNTSTKFEGEKLIAECTFYLINQNASIIVRILFIQDNNNFSYNIKSCK